METRLEHLLAGFGDHDGTPLREQASGASHDAAFGPLDVHLHDVDRALHEIIQPERGDDGAIPTRDLVGFVGHQAGIRPDVRGQMRPSPMIIERDREQRDVLELVLSHGHENHPAVLRVGLDREDVSRGSNEARAEDRVDADVRADIDEGHAFVQNALQDGGHLGFVTTTREHLSGDREVGSVEDDRHPVEIGRRDVRSTETDMHGGGRTGPVESRQDLAHGVQVLDP